MATENHSSSVDDNFMTTQELMRFLNLSRGKIWELVRSGGLPAFKMGSEYRYRRSEVIEWMEQFRLIPTEEQEDESSRD